jgi:hypothetical protein
LQAPNSTQQRQPAPPPRPALCAYLFPGRSVTHAQTSHQVVVRSLLALADLSLPLSHRHAYDAPRASSIRWRRRFAPLGAVSAAWRKWVGPSTSTARFWAPGSCSAKGNAEQPVVRQVLAGGARAAGQAADRIKHPQLRMMRVAGSPAATLNGGSGSLSYGSRR